jgi:hypothetical protein
MRGKVFDLRLPLGYLFAILGGLLVIKVASEPPISHARSLGINLNLIWGSVMVLFGGWCLFLAARRRRSLRQERP